MKNHIVFKALVAFILLLSVVVPFKPAAAGKAPVLPTFTDFVGQVLNGEPDTVRGVYVSGVLALRVAQQPPGEPGTVYPMNGVATQFRAAADNHNIGLLAHNNLAGATFSALRIGQEVRIVYGGGRVDYFIVNQLASFQALQPESQYGDFVDLSSDVTYSAGDIFGMFYTGSTHVTFQTCILKDGEASWGRLFVTAVPYFSVNFRDFRIFKFELGWSKAR